jgi:hypothetical protein
MHVVARLNKALQMAPAALIPMHRVGRSRVDSCVPLGVLLSLRTPFCKLLFCPSPSASKEIP